MAGNYHKPKILYILKLLYEKSDELHPIKTSELIELLKNEGITAERKSIYTDIATLCDFGIPIEYIKPKGYYIEERLFELAELKLLVDAVGASKFITEKKSEALIKKLSSLATKSASSSLKRQLYRDGRIKSMNNSIYYSVDIIHSAINTNKKILFQYFDYTPDKQKKLRHNGEYYCVSPFALCWKEENYYLVSFDSRESKIKHFRVDKMQNLKESAEKREGEIHFKSFDMISYSNKTFGMFGGREDSVTLECDDSLAGVIIDRFGKEVSIFKGNNGKFKVSVRVLVSNNFFAWVLEFDGKIKITAPAEVKNEMRSFVSKAYDDYR